jgi:hypothetical protein
MWIVYFPAGFYFIYLAIKARTFFFFSASNPSIEHGGMLFESKWKIFKLMPKHLYPKTIFVSEIDSIEIIEERIIAEGLLYPLIAKPDIGGRGFGVKRIHTPIELAAYRKAVGVTFLIQECVNYPLELSVFYFRKPNEEKGKITSLTVKELLSVVGDGVSTIKQLLIKNDRAFLQYEKLAANNELDFSEVLNQGEKKIVVPYGNHVLGAKFLNCQHLIDEELNERFDSISKQIQGFYFGRYDIRCTSIEDLKKGINMSILELNGAGAEPAHIYDPEFSYLKAQSELASYFRNMYIASSENHKSGVPYMRYSDFKYTRKMERAYKQKINLA